MLPSDLDTSSMRVFVNPSGNFVLGGPHADTGLTGRKIIVDTYGGMARHGGGAFSGKDPSKVDRSAAYAARWVAKHVVASGAAERCEVQVAYAIGVARPVSVLVETFGTERVDRQKIAKAVDALFDLRPAAIIRDLDLRRPIYQRTAAYGHFGRTDLGLHVGADAAARRPAPGTVADLVTARAVRVITEVAAVDRPFDYALDDVDRTHVRLGDRVRVDFNHRSVRGWVVDDAEYSHGSKDRQEVAGLRPASLDAGSVEVGERRWYGSWSRFLLSASPHHLVHELPVAPAAAPLSGAVRDAAWERRPVSCN